MSDVVNGIMGAGALDSETNALAFVIQRLMASARHVAIAVVKAVNPAGTGALGAVIGTVDVQPMVHQIDGLGTPKPHGIIHGLPYFRLQAGNVAIIMDPVVGDIGIAVFADRDTSLVRQSKVPSQPGSFRRFSWSDGIYIGGILNGAPQHYVSLRSGGGSRGTAPQGIVISSNLPIQVQGDLYVTGEIIAGYGTADRVGLQTHIHGQPNDAHGDAEQPTFTPTPGF